MKLILPDAIKTQILRQYGEHLAGPNAADETGWLLLGWGDTDDDEIEILTAIHSKGKATPTRFTFDCEYLINKVLTLRQADPTIVVVGTVHSHPVTHPRPSAKDFDGHMAWLQTLDLKTAVFGIITPESLRFYALTEIWHEYREVRPTAADQQPPDDPAVPAPR